MELYLHSSIRPHGAVLSYVQAQFYLYLYLYLYLTLPYLSSVEYILLSPMLIAFVKNLISVPKV